MAMNKLLTSVVCGAAALGLGVNCALLAARNEVPPWAAAAARAAPMAPSLDGATGWLNSPALTAEQLRGKVVLVDFWTYSCVNCLRALPYVRAWAQKYRAAGLVVVGVHTPEFGFESRSPNVQRAVRDLQIDFPVALDDRRAVWQAFGNRGWPALYFVDAQGRVRHQQYGEGRYEDAERLIQQLLKEAGRSGVPTGFVAPQGQGTQAAAGPVAPASGETYVGFERASNFVSADGGLRPGRDHAYAAAPALRRNEWTLAGTWRVDDESALLRQPGGRIAYRFRARDLHLVLGTDSGSPVRFRVRIDGRPPGADHGADTDADGLGTVDAHRLYQLVRQASGAAERTFEIEFLDAGAHAYAFTFG
jgi:thiol-disulfide isomerase/thioredoxin